MILGQDQSILLVQSHTGQVGFVPSKHLAPQRSLEPILIAGPIDLGWIGVGGFWGMLNWLAIGQALIASSFLPRTVQWVAMLALVLGIAAAIIMRARQKIEGRSFALGALLAYLLLFLAAKGL
jgi:hypothetical protein